MTKNFGDGAQYVTTFPVKGLRNAGYVGPCTVTKDGVVIEVIENPPTWDDICAKRRQPQQQLGADNSKKIRRNNRDNQHTPVSSAGEALPHRGPAGSDRPGRKPLKSFARL